MWQRAKRFLQEKISSLFYSHGLFCASHPFAIISLVITIILMTSYPLTTLPLPGNAPLQYRTPKDNYKVPPISLPTTAKEESVDKRPRWYFGAPVAYILQIVVKSTVSPWVPKTHIQTDAFRAPLSKAFDIVQHINNFQYKASNSSKEKSTTLNDVCLHVFETVASKKAKGLLPEYNCLTISPAHFWSNDKSQFDADSQIVKTVTKSYGKPLDLPPSIHDLLFGIPLKDTGIRRIFFRNRQRVISYAVTVLFKKYDSKFMSALRGHIQHLYPLHLLANSSSDTDQHFVHAYFKDVNYFVEYTPLILAYTVLFLYLYFSVRKIEMVKSKWGLALSAVVTVVSSLLMSIGICTLFGLTPSLNGSEIFPYLVVIIGLENVLVVTKSVVSTPVNLDVKLRVAQGLQKEGWYIFKNLMMEMLILTVGFFTFVPAIQEFCLFAVVGLLSDFFLQMFFFTTVLSIDIRRMELSDLQKQSVHVTIPESLSDDENSQKPGSHYSSLSGRTGTSGTYSPYIRPTANTVAYGKRLLSTQSSQGNFTDEFSMIDPIRKTPKRVKLMNYWARTRFMQRAIMVCVVIWIALIAYKTGLVEHLVEVTMSNMANNRGERDNLQMHTTPPTSDPFHRELSDNDAIAKGRDHGLLSEPQTTPDNAGKYIHGLLTHQTTEKWRELSYNHWPTLLSHYNLTMRGRYITMLPSIHLSLPISTEEAVSLRHPKEESAISHLSEAIQPPTEVHDADLDAREQDPTLVPHKAYTNLPPKEQLPFLTLNRLLKRVFRTPQSRTELVMTVLLGIASFILWTYCMTKLYMCMCSRNYHRGRNWWFTEKRRKKQSPYFKQLRETVPLVLESHVQEIECLVTDGPLIVSACLAGQLSVWDSSSGECITSINRKREPPLGQRSPAVGSSMESMHDLRDFSEQPRLIPPTEIMSTSLPRAETGMRMAPHHRRNYSADFSMLEQITQQHSPTPPLASVSSVAATPTSSTAARQTHKRHSSYGRFPLPTMADIIPDLSGAIDTDFSAMSKANLLDSGTQQQQQLSSTIVKTTDTPGIFDFSGFEKYYDEHRQMVAEKAAYMAHRRGGADSSGSGDGKAESEEGTEGGRVRSLSQGDCPDPVPSGEGVLFRRDAHDDLAPAIWCLACQDSLIVAGCGNGRIEFWDGLTGAQKFVHQDGVQGVTAVCVVGHKVIAARLNGVVDFLELETSMISPAMGGGLTSPSSVHKRQMPGGIKRINSSGALSGEYPSWDDVIHIKMIDSVCAHQRPINVLQSEGGRVITASQDHTLKVFRVEDSLRLYTLHGHTGGVTALFLDKAAPLAAASGAEDGTVRLWDLMTGACVHKLRGHTATVMSVMCTSLYVISVGMDDQLCVWERCKGHLLHYIHMEQGYCNTVSMLTSNLMVTGGQGCLHLWDVSKGEVLRAVTLGDSNPSVFIRHLRVIGNSTVVCDYGNQLRVIHFPAVLEKAD